jgi:hypothetical protein
MQLHTLSVVSDMYDDFVLWQKEPLLTVDTMKPWLNRASSLHSGAAIFTVSVGRLAYYMQ